MIIYWYYWCCFEAVSPIFPLNSRFIWTRPMGIPARTPRTPAPMGWRSTEAPPAGTSRKMRIRTNRTWGIYDHQPIPLTFCFCHIVSPRQCVFFSQSHRKNSQICIFAGRWIGLIIANYIVNRWKQTLINTNYGKITSLHHPDLLGLYFGPAIFCKVRKHGGTYGI